MRRASNQRRIEAKQQPTQRANHGGLERFGFRLIDFRLLCAAGLEAKWIRTVLISYGFVDTVSVLPCREISFTGLSIRSVSEAACAP